MTGKLSRNLRWRIAVCESGVDVTGKLVGLVLDTFMDGDGFAWPSRTTIAKRAGVSVRTVERAVDRLEDVGLLVIHRSHGRRSHRYYASLPTSSPVATLVESNVVTGDGPTSSLVTRNVATGDDRSRKEAVIGSRLRKGALTRTAPETTQQLVAHFRDVQSAEGIPRSSDNVGKAARYIGRLVKDGIAPELIARAVELSVERRLDPSVIPSLIGEAAAGPGHRRNEHIADRMLRSVIEDGRNAQ